MRIARHITIASCVTVAVWAGLWSPQLAVAQSREKWCLTFHEVHPALTAREARQEGVPPGYRIYPADDDASELLLRAAPVLHGGELADAQPGVSFRTQLAILTFRFNDEGTRKLAEFTRANIGQAFAIVVDGRVISAPIINEPILGGAGEISGSSFTPDSVARLAARLRSPACTQVSRRLPPGRRRGSRTDVSFPGSQPDLPLRPKGI